MLVVHLYTYDLFAEKMGFKLSWGCLVFYPFFYAIGVHAIVRSDPSIDISSTTAAVILSIFFIGWIFTRGANMQKFYYRTQPQHKTFLFGLVPQKTVPGTSILCSGWWGVSRHFNYCGEIVQGVALALPGFLMVLYSPSLVDMTNFPFASFYFLLQPWLYPLYYLALFIPRQADDDEVCKRKYGQKWDEYTRLVPYRIFPGLY